MVEANPLVSKNENFDDNVLQNTSKKCIKCVRSTCGKRTGSTNYTRNAGSS